MSIKDPIHIGIVDASSGEFIPDNKEYFQWDWDGFRGKRIGLKFKETNRSNEFNAYYWVGVVRIFVDFFNQEKTFGRIVDKDWVHELLTAKFLGYTQQTIPGGEIVSMRNKSSKLSTKKFWEYEEYCKVWGRQLFNLTFPEKPNQDNSKLPEPQEP